MKFKKRTFWRSEELSLQWKRLGMQTLPRKWKLTRFQPKKKSGVTAPTVFSINQMMNSSKSSRKLNSQSWIVTTLTTKTHKTSVDSVGKPMLRLKIHFWSVAAVQDPLDQSTWNVCSSGCPPNANPKSCKTLVLSFGRLLSAKSAKKPIL